MCKTRTKQTLAQRERERDGESCGWEGEILFSVLQERNQVQIGSTCPKGLGEEEREREREINKTNKRRIHAKNLQMLTGPCYLFEAYCNPITEYLLKVFLLGSCSAKFAETQRHRERERDTHTHTQRGGD